MIFYSVDLSDCLFVDDVCGFSAHQECAVFESDHIIGVIDGEFEVVSYEQDGDISAVSEFNEELSESLLHGMRVAVPFGAGNRVSD